ncbi:MAG: DUF4136 domain-containing protein [Cyclobacteriaceae bacterium]
MRSAVYSTIILFLSIAIFTNCQPRIVHFTNSKASFDSYNTYSVVNTKKSIGETVLETDPATITAKQIRLEMNRRGYLEKANSDLVVRFELIASTVSMQVDNVDPFSPFVPSNNFGNSSREESALLIEIIDRSTRKTIWQASQDLRKYEKSSVRERILNETVSRLFDTYLYRANQSTIDETLRTNK